MSRLRQPPFRFWIGWHCLVSLVFSQANASTGRMRWIAGADAADVSQNITTSYTYDAGNNRTGKTESRLWEGASWVYSHNSLNQLTGFTKTTLDGDGQTAGVETVSFGYDARGNRVSRSVGGTVTAAYHWDEENRLNAVAKDGLGWRYDYDYRTRRIGIVEGSGDPAGAGFQEGHFTVVVFSGGLSVAEYEGFSPEQTRMDASRPSVSYVRGPDLGGGVGGLVASLRVAPGSVTATPRYNVSNGRGDIVAQSDGQGQITWTASYEAFGQRPVETGTNPDRQRANSKEEDPTGLLNEGFRYRDLETGTWLSRDPAGFVDGPNLYAYVKQNPWTAFDPLGLSGWQLYNFNAPPQYQYTNAEYREGFNQGVAKGFVIGASITVGVAVTVFSGGAALAGAGAVLGEGTVATGLTAAAASGALGGVATSTTANILTGEEPMKGTVKAAALGAVGGVVGQVLGDTVVAFKQGYSSAVASGESQAAVQTVENVATAPVTSAPKATSSTVPEAQAAKTPAPHFSGTDKPWTKGATPGSTYTHIDPKTGKAVQNAVYDDAGDVVGHVDFKNHGPGAPSGHGHTFPQPGNPASGHGKGKPHIPNNQLPPGWDTLPPGVQPHTPLGQ